MKIKLHSPFWQFLGRERYLLRCFWKNTIHYRGHFAGPKLDKNIIFSPSSLDLHKPNI
tara:strand:+ start:355 stop:528 length:174 start_codon:yes stop_codon:yes gene_type:complete